MTEQDNREKESRKIWELIKQHYTPTCTACFEEEKECFICAADAIYDYMMGKIAEAKKAGIKEMLDYLRKMALTQEDMSYDCYVKAKDWAEKTFGIAEEDPNLQKMPACNVDLHKALEEGTGLYGTALEALLASNDETAEPMFGLTPSELWDIALKHCDEERKKRWKH